MRARGPRPAFRFPHAARSLLVALLAACGGGGDAPPTSPPVTTVTAVTVTPPTVALVEGDSLALTATATLSDGSTGARNAIWTSSAPSIATVSSTGRVNAIAVGSATMTATIGSASATSTITVARRVAAIALDVSARALLIGETLAILPTVTFADGAPAAGKVLTWNSSSSAVATVNGLGVITAIASGSATITATVDGRIATVAITVRPPTQTTLNTASATSATIGAAGGVLTTTAAGISYRLEIPANALPVETVIRMTPIASLTNLPLSGGLVAAVDLQPSGLRFARPLTLRIGTTASAPAGLVLTGFSITGASPRTEREFATARSNEIVLAIKHFSAAGVGLGTNADVSSIPFNYSATPAAERAVNAFFDAARLTPANSALVLTTISAWFDAGVLPQLQSASNDSELTEALYAYDFWKFGVYELLSLPISGFEPQLLQRSAQWLEAVRPKLQQAITGNNQLCAAQRSLAALQNELFWHRWVTQFGLNTGDLQRGRVLEQLCVSLVVRNVRLPNPVQAGFPNDLDAEFALKFGANPTLVSIPVSVAFSGSGPTFAKTSPANSDANGAFTVAVTARNNAAFTVSLIGCLVMTFAEDICALETVNGTSLDLTGSYTGSFSSRITMANGTDILAFVPVNIQMTQTQNAITGTYDVMQFNGLRGILSATLSTTELLNFTLTQFAPCVGSFRGTSSITASTRRVQSLYAGSDCAGTHSNGVSDISPGTRGLRDFNGSWTTGFHASGRPMNLWFVAQSGTFLSISYSVLNTQTLELECQTSFQTHIAAGAEGFTAEYIFALTPLFPRGSTVTFSPDPSRARGARITTSQLGLQVTRLVNINPPELCR